MRFLDLNTFYAPTGGGIRTYHNAKLAWFARHPEHDYTLVAPGERRRVEPLAPNVRLVYVRGLATSRTPGGYRLLLDMPGVRRAVERFRPDVIEAGDPWLSSRMALRLRQPGVLVSSFLHADPVRTWLDPFADRSGPLQPARRALARVLGRRIHTLQSRFDLSVVASQHMAVYLRAHGVPHVVRVPFGVDERFFVPPPPRDPTAPVRLLYAGRLGVEKGAKTLLDALPSLLDLPNVELTVVGRGALADRFDAVKHPRYRRLGFIADPDELAALYRAHSVYLALSPFETFGLSLLEAMASGLVPVGADAGGVAEQIEGAGLPFTFAPGDARSLVQTVQRVLESDLNAAAQQAYHAARTTYGTWDDAVQRLVTMYERATVARGLRPMPLPDALP